MKGCRTGRMVWDSAISQAELKRPIERYFRHVEARILEALAEQASAAGEINVHTSPDQIAAIVLATIQGAFTLGRAMQDSKLYDRTIQGAVSLIRCAIDSIP